MRFVLLPIEMFIGLVCPLAAFAASFTPLGDLPGGTFHSGAHGVSADGSTVVGYALSASGTEAFVWDAANGMTGLGHLPDTICPATKPGESCQSQAVGVSADGSIVAGWSSPGSGVEAFRWDATNGMTGLGFIPGGIISEATGISADGSTVVGWSRHTGSNQAFLWDAANGMQVLVGMREANGISADGSTVVGWSRSGSPDQTGSIDEAVAWDATNGIAGLGFMPGGTFTAATGVSADGSTVVGVGDSASGSREAFVWDAASGMEGLGDLPGGSFWSAALGVSADGSTVVGWSIGASANREAFLWDATNGMQSLQVVLSALDVDLTGWQLKEATGISADGNTIVGYGTNPSGFTEAFVAVIPEPSTALLVGLGLAVIGAARTRKKLWIGQRSSQLPS